MKPKRIPLFPLEVVLFPGIPLPLHIFEPRYKLMIRRCVDEKLEFGVVLAREGGIARTGCTAAITQVLRTYPDGKMDITTEGRAVYQVLDVIEEKPYYEADVEYLEDDLEIGVRSVDNRKKLLELYNRCHTLLFNRAPAQLELRPGILLSFQIASELPFDLDFRQDLLESRSESGRQDHLRERLAEWAPQLEHHKRVKQKASGNGHGLG
jgi:Lon protease-like protein